MEALLTKKDAKALYDEFEQAISADCGGDAWKGWDSKKIHAKVTEFQPKFAEKGIKVTYHMVTWQTWVSNGQYGGHMQIHYRYWMTYADIEITGETVLADTFDPTVDYEAKAKETKKEEVTVTVSK